MVGLGAMAAQAPSLRLIIIIILTYRELGMFSRSVLVLG